MERADFATDMHIKQLTLRSVHVVRVSFVRLFNYLVLTYQTQDYRDLAAREYLALLHQLLPENVPCLYSSGDDAQGIHIDSIRPCVV